MSERSSLISRLLSSVDIRAAYIKAKLGVLVPSQIRALRLSSDMPRQADLAKTARLHQSRISMFETPGAANMTIETLSRLAASFEVGLIVQFVPMSEMLRWENQFSQDSFQVTKLSKDDKFLVPESVPSASRMPTGGDLQKFPIQSAAQEIRVPSSFYGLGLINASKSKSAGAA